MGCIVSAASVSPSSHNSAKPTSLLQPTKILSAAIIKTKSVLAHLQILFDQLCNVAKNNPVHSLQADLLQVATHLPPAPLQKQRFPATVHLIRPQARESDGRVPQNCTLAVAGVVYLLRLGHEVVLHGQPRVERDNVCFPTLLLD